jgi:hypothetical protein
MKLVLGRYVMLWSSQSSRWLMKRDPTRPSEFVPRASARKWSVVGKVVVVGWGESSMNWRVLSMDDVMPSNVSLRRGQSFVVIGEQESIRDKVKYSVLGAMMNSDNSFSKALVESESSRVISCTSEGNNAAIVIKIKNEDLNFRRLCYSPWGVVFHSCQFVQVMVCRRIFVSHSDFQTAWTRDSYVE